jgi:hypothetical protein
VLNLALLLQAAFFSAASVAAAASGTAVRNPELAYVIGE